MQWLQCQILHWNSSTVGLLHYCCGHLFSLLFFFSFCKTVKCFNDAHIIDYITGVVIMRYSEGELFPVLFNPIDFFFVSRERL